VRAQLYNELGGFDPNIFMYAEDTDLCKRIRDKDYAIGYAAKARVTHMFGQSSQGELRPRMVYENNRSRIYYFAKHEGEKTASKARSMMAAGAFLRAGIWSVISILSPSKHELAKNNAAGFVQIAKQTMATETHPAQIAVPEDVIGV
jgi:GT2 family glycosyltransferase